MNEVLANITISALTLNTWYSIVNGTDSRVVNVYHFQRHLNFFLPYGLCLLFTLPIVAMGLLAFRHNGVWADRGGDGCSIGLPRWSRERAQGPEGTQASAPGGTAYRDVELNESGEDIALMRISQERGLAGDEDPASSQAGVVSRFETYNAGVIPSRRAGFGTASETKPLRRGEKLDS
ncbi:uncharacterized protein M421DRAFT_91070 [Didymella exigua CBS 183.55]|uniref:Uncharacterized protein n=1 Tax=Didymella exigua CBS 183.55 TaxID=1150837 RepID=A0A6A5RU72_9PLEO|nr:uncharacterized protein M421DRAFT_91070 [Didymella exigua CBS 183.55]KAF1930568.1 hypothetical protein M421DRAFT_91070 [Didymella exigua CBS 183.55]